MRPTDSCKGCGGARWWCAQLSVACLRELTTQLDQEGCPAKSTERRPKKRGLCESRSEVWKSRVHKETMVKRVHGGDRVETGLNSLSLWVPSRFIRCYSNVRWRNGSTRNCNLPLYFPSTLFSRIKSCFFFFFLSWRCGIFTLHELQDCT